MDYMSLFPAWFREKPRFAALAQAILTQVNDLMAVIQSIPAAYSPDFAEGACLDAIGEASGCPRPDGMSDTDYRQYLMATFALFSWDGSNETAQTILSTTFPGSTISDNINKTVTIHPVSQLQVDHHLYPLPAGYRAIIS